MKLLHVQIEYTNSQQEDVESTTSVLTRSVTDPDGDDEERLYLHDLLDEFLDNAGDSPDGKFSITKCECYSPEEIEEMEKKFEEKIVQFRSDD